MKPFSTYPEDRAKMLELCEKIEAAEAYEDMPPMAEELANIVKQILLDEQFVIDAEINQKELDADMDKAIKRINEGQK